MLKSRPVANVLPVTIVEHFIGLDTKQHIVGKTIFLLELA